MLRFLIILICETLTNTLRSIVCCENSAPMYKVPYVKQLKARGLLFLNAIKAALNAAILRLEKWALVNNNNRISS